MAQANPSRPPFNPAYQTAAGIPGMGSTLDLAKMREVLSSSSSTAEIICKQNPHIVHTELKVPIPSHTEGENESTTQLSIFAHRSTSKTKRAVLYFVHGGGQVLFDRFMGVESLIRFFPDNDDIIVATIEYRLAPNHPAPAAAHDCYEGLVYLSEHAAELGIDPGRIIIYGTSGGGGVAAAAVLLARQRNRDLVCAQILNIPMLDDRSHFVSSKQFWAGTVWDGQMNQQAWKMILGSNDNESVDEIRCPGRATCLGGLPPTFIDVGECEVFRDSAVAYASGIWRDGGSAELHVWPGVHHGATTVQPEVPVSKAQEAAQKDFIKRTLGL